MLKWSCWGKLAVWQGETFLPSEGHILETSSGQIHSSGTRHNAWCDFLWLPVRRKSAYFLYQCIFCIISPFWWWRLVQTTSNFWTNNFLFLSYLFSSSVGFITIHTVLSTRPVPGQILFDLALNKKLCLLACCKSLHGSQELCPGCISMPLCNSATCWPDTNISHIVALFSQGHIWISFQQQLRSLQRTTEQVRWGEREINTEQDVLEPMPNYKKNLI